MSRRLGVYFVLYYRSNDEDAISSYMCFTFSFLLQNNPMASKHSSSWPDLPSELLGLVLRRLDSFADRIRVAAVCKPWRSGARLQYPQLPPPMPWIALGDKAYLDIVNNTVHRLNNLTVPHYADCCGSVDNLLFLTRGGGGCFLADPFSGAVRPVTDLAFYLVGTVRSWLKRSVLYGTRRGSTSSSLVASC